MNITIVFRNRGRSERLKTLAEELTERLSRYFHAIHYVEWDISRDGELAAVRCRVHSRSGFYRAHGSAPSAPVALEQAFEKLITARRRKKSKRLGGRRRVTN